MSLRPLYVPKNIPTQAGCQCFFVNFCGLKITKALDFSRAFGLKRFYVNLRELTVGGDEGDRTPGLGIANAALSQLSYIPVIPTPKLLPNARRDSENQPRKANFPFLTWLCQPIFNLHNPSNGKPASGRHRRGSKRGCQGLSRTPPPRT